MRELFEEADRLDAAEADQEPEDDDPSGRAARAEARRAAIRIAKERLAALDRAKEECEARAAEKKERWDSISAEDRPHRKVPTGVPESDDRANLTDSDSRLMKLKSGGYAQAYNANVAVEASHQIIVGTSLSSDPTDYYQLKPTVESVKEVTGESPEKYVTDAGYCSNANVSYLEEQGISALICPSRNLPELLEPPPSNPPAAEAPADSEMKVRQKMVLALSTEAGRATYSQRKCTVEPVFGQIKGSAGNPGMIGFLTRGIENCRVEWLLHCAVHNIGKLMRFGPQLHKEAELHRPQCVSNRRNVLNAGQISLNMAGF